MRTQQEAERAEQQRIKRLVLNYDSTREDDEDIINGIYAFRLQRNPNRPLRRSRWLASDDDHDEYPYPYDEE